MKNERANLLLFLVTLLFSCHQPSKDLTHISDFTFPPTLIQQCIDSTIILDSNVNTKHFYVDLELLKEIDLTSVNSYLDENKDVKITDFDSLTKAKSSWLKKEFFQNDIIRFEKVEKLGGDTIFIEMTKRRAIDASLGAEIILKKVGQKFIWVESGISWIN
jgi:hypothetical protein